MYIAALVPSAVDMSDRSCEHANAFPITASVARQFLSIPTQFTRYLVYGKVFLYPITSYHNILRNIVSHPSFPSIVASCHCYFNVVTENS